MSPLPLDYPVSGTSETDFPFSSFPIPSSSQTIPATRTGADPGEGDAPNVFERLVRIMRSNERLSIELRTTSNRLHSTRAYLVKTDCNVSLGTAYFRYWRAKHSGILTLLRANRLEARRLLAQLDPDVLKDHPTSTESLVPPLNVSIHAPDSRLSRLRSSQELM